MNGEFLPSNLDDSINFELPAAWTAAGPIHLKAIVDPARTFAEANLANNVVELDASFVQTKTLRLRFVR